MEQEIDIGLVHPNSPYSVLEMMNALEPSCGDVVSMLQGGSIMALPPLRRPRR